MIFRFTAILLFWAAFDAAARPANAADTQPASQPAVSMDLELCRTSDGPFTVADFVPYLKARTSAFQAQEPDEMQIYQPPSSLASGARRFLYERELSRRAREENPELPPIVQATIDRYRYDTVSELLSSAAKKRSENITDDEAREFYEDNTILFRAQLKFSIRHLFWSSYVPYVAQPGDTLEGIAASVSGDAAKVTGIVTDEDWKVLRWIPPAERGQRPFRDAIPGEKLLVPMSDELRAETRAMFGQVLAKLDEGVDFETLCRQFSEAEDKGNIVENLPFGNYPTQPEILKAGKTLPVGEVSGIIETDHGFEAIQVTKRTDESLASFEDVKEPIKDKLRKQKYMKEMEREKAECLALLEIDAKALIDPKASPGQTAISLGERHWTAGQVYAFPGVRDNLVMVQDEKQIREALGSHQPILGAAREEYARQKGLLDDEDFLLRRKYTEMGIVAQETIKLAQDKAAAEITEEQLRKWHDENPEHFSPPKKFVVRQIAKGLSPEADLKDPEQRAAAEKEALDALREGVKGVQSTADFIAAARELSDDRQGAAKDGLIGPVLASYKPGAFGDTMNSLQERVASEPFIYGDLAYVIWIDEIVSPPPAAFEKVEMAVRQRVEAETRAAVEKEMIEDALESVGYSPNPELQ